MNEFFEQMLIFMGKKQKLYVALKEARQTVIQIIREIDDLEDNVYQLKEWRDKNAVQIPESGNTDTQTGREIKTGQDV